MTPLQLATVFLAVVAGLLVGVAVTLEGARRVINSKVEPELAKLKSLEERSMIQRWRYELASLNLPAEVVDRYRAAEGDAFEHPDDRTIWELQSIPVDWRLEMIAYFRAMAAGEHWRCTVCDRHLDDVRHLVHAREGRRLFICDECVIGLQLLIDQHRKRHPDEDELGNFICAADPEAGSLPGPACSDAPALDPKP